MGFGTRELVWGLSLKWNLSITWCRSLAHRSCVEARCDTAVLGCRHLCHIYNAHAEKKTQDINVKPCLYLMTSCTQTEATLKLPTIGDHQSSKEIFKCHFQRINFHRNWGHRQMSQKFEQVQHQERLIRNPIKKITELRNSNEEFERIFITMC